MLFIALLILTALWILTAGLSPWRRVTNYAEMCAQRSNVSYEPATVDNSVDTDNSKASDSQDQSSWKPEVSIVAYIHRDEENLSEYIDLLLSQQFRRMEVVLVCDASAEATAMISERFENVRNLHITFVPPGSHNLSRRKLAQTIGIKAAKGEVIILTASSVHPMSPYWAAAMSEDLLENPAVAVTLGYVRPVTSDYTGPYRWYRRFDHLIDTVSWMDAALADDAFRGDGYDMAIRRKAFFDNKGYAATLPLMDGDDDIFIRELSRFGKVTLCLSPDAVVDSNWGDQTDRRHIDLKDRRMFTQRYLPPRPFIRLGLLSGSQWGLILWGFLSILAALLAFLLPAGAISTWTETYGFITQALILDPEPEAIAIGVLVFLVMVSVWLTESFTYRRLAASLGSSRLFWSVPVFMLWRPIGNLLFGINHRTGRKAHFTWQR